MFNSRFTKMFELDYPVMSAPMALHSGGTLAAAVSRAGGLGSFGAINPFEPATWVTDQIEQIRAATDRPFVVGYITNFIPMFEEQFTAAIDAKVPVIALSFGQSAPWAERAKASGAKVICQVQSLESAKEAIESGADVLIAQGNEAGGHTGTMNLLPLLTEIVATYPSVPVLAAGGITSGHALAGVMAAGADGACLGTAFLATPEAVEIPDEHKRLIVESDGQDTTFTRVYDVASGLPWPDGIAFRVRRNRFVDEWDARLDEIPANRDRLNEIYQKAKREFDADVVDVAYGQGAAAIDSVRPAEEVIRRICDDAEAVLKDRQSLLA